MDLIEVREVLESYKVQSQAKAGVIAPVDVVIPAGASSRVPSSAASSLLPSSASLQWADPDAMRGAGSTGMGPEKTSFFQALNLPTKITKGSIEILNNVTVVHTGEKVGLSEAKLLNMLSISPFWSVPPTLALLPCHQLLRLARFVGPSYSFWVSLTHGVHARVCVALCLSSSRFPLHTSCPLALSLAAPRLICVCHCQVQLRGQDDLRQRIDLPSGGA